VEWKDGSDLEERVYATLESAKEWTHWVQFAGTSLGALQRASDAIYGHQGFWPEREYRLEEVEPGEVDITSLLCFEDYSQAMGYLLQP